MQNTDTKTPAQRRQALILATLKEARAAIGLAAPVRTLGKIDHAIALLERSGDCDGIDTAHEVRACPVNTYRS